MIAESGGVLIANGVHKKGDNGGSTRKAPASVNNTKGYSSTYLAMACANVRAGTRYPPEH